MTLLDDAPAQSVDPTVGTPTVSPHGGHNALSYPSVFVAMSAALACSLIATFSCRRTPPTTALVVASALPGVVRLMSATAWPLDEARHGAVVSGVATNAGGRWGIVRNTLPTWRSGLCVTAAGDLLHVGATITRSACSPMPWFARVP